MAYQTGVSGSVNDFTTALTTFAAANGFTAGPAWTNAGVSFLTLLKDGIYFVFGHNSTQLVLNTATSITGTGNEREQPGAAAVTMLINPIVGPHISYHFFCDGTVCNAVAEVATNVFSHVNFGFVTKNGSWTGGAFVSGTNTTTSGAVGAKGVLSGYNVIPFHTTSIGAGSTLPGNKPHIRSSITAVNGISGFGTDLTGSASVSYNKGWFSEAGGRSLVLSNPNIFNGRSVIVPITMIQSSAGSSGPYYQLGHVPNAGIINIANIEPKSIVNTDWMVFPIGQKGTAETAYIASSNYAMAYKQ